VRAAPDVPPCVVGATDRQLLGGGASPIVCGSDWSECETGPLASNDPAAAGSATCCMRLDVATKKIDHVARPLLTAPFVARISGKQLCIDGTCKPVGKQLADAIAKLDHEEVKLVRATDDMKVFRVGSTAWGLAEDAPLKLRPPPRYQRSKGVVAQLEIVGNVFVADWTDCAGPCDQSRIYTSSNAVVGEAIDGYVKVTQVTDKVFALVSDVEGLDGSKAKDRFQLFELRTGKASGTVPLPAQTGAPVVRLDTDTFAVMYEADRGARIAIVSAANPDKPALVGEMTLPSCEP